MKIGELAEVTGLKIDTIRYYEGAGLLARHQRTESGYRIFTAEDVERIEFIKQAKRLGLSLTEIRDILSIQAVDQPTCVHVRGLLEAKVQEVEQALQELTEFRSYLRRLLERSVDLVDCRPEGGRICSIIEQASVPQRPEVLERLRPAGGRSA